MAAKKLSSSMEDYIETIALLKREKGVARVRDISRKMGVKYPSVNAALATLTRMGLTEHERYGYVDLTAEGVRMAEAIQEKHGVLFKFLTSVLNITRETADEDACSMEHCVSPQTMDKLTKFVEFVEGCSKEDKPECLKMFDSYVETGVRSPCAPTV